MRRRGRSLREVHFSMKAAIEVKKKIILFLLCVFAFLPAAEGANSWSSAYTGGVWNNPGSALLDTMIYNKMMAGASLKKMQRENSVKAGAPEISRTVYRPSSSPSKVPLRVAEVFSNENASKKELTAFFKEALVSFDQISNQAGRPHDLGFALAFFAGVCVGISTENEVDDSAILAAATQMDRLLAEQPGMVSATNAGKKDFAEVLACMAIFALAGHNQAEEEGNGEAADSFRQFGRQAMIEFLGMDPHQLRMDGQGIHIIR